MSGAWDKVGDTRHNPDGSVSTIVDNGDDTLGTITTGIPDSGPIYFNPTRGIPIPPKRVTATPDLVQAAIDHIRTIHPTVTHVFYSTEAKWLYCDDEFEHVEFTGDEDIGLLEDAVDSLPYLPAAYYFVGDEV